MKYTNIIDESKIVEKIQESKALAYLINLNAVLLPINIEEKDGTITTGIYVNANDVFMWGCADVEPIVFNDGDSPSEIIELYKMVKESPYGEIKWLCIKRNCQPQYAYVKKLKTEGYWDETFEALPLNSDNPLNH